MDIDSAPDVAGVGSVHVPVGQIIDDLRGGGREENAAIAHEVLAAKRGPHRDIVLVNAAAALLISGRVDERAGRTEIKQSPLVHVVAEPL